MLVVTVEIWPRGDVLRRRVIGTMNLANVSELAEVSNYEGWIDGERIAVKGHLRSEGAWALTARALEPFVQVLRTMEVAEPRCEHETLAYTSGKHTRPYWPGCTICGNPAARAG